MDDNGRSLGTVQWFSRVKGYGFIRPDGEEEDVFVHYSSIQGDGFRKLTDGDEVEFDIVQGDKGLHAENVQVTRG